MRKAFNYYLAYRLGIALTRVGTALLAKKMTDKQRMLALSVDDINNVESVNLGTEEFSLRIQRNGQHTLSDMRGNSVSFILQEDLAETMLTPAAAFPALGYITVDECWFEENRGSVEGLRRMMGILLHESRHMNKHLVAAAVGVAGVRWGMEIDADNSAAKLGYGRDLADALEEWDEANTLSGIKRFLSYLTHPPMSWRIRRLRNKGVSATPEFFKATVADLRVGDIAKFGDLTPFEVKLIEDLENLKVIIGPGNHLDAEDDEEILILR